MNKIVLIPSLEPDNKLIKLVDELINNQLEVVVINDGSSTRYNPIFNQIKEKAMVLEYETNKGKGYALKYGLKYIKEHYQDYIVVTMDSDGQHTVKDAIKLEKYIEKHPKELVLGKRLRSKDIPLRSRIGNGITKFIYNLVTGLNIYDTQTGLRAFSNYLTDYLLEVEGDRFEYEMNVLLYSRREQIKITEIEIETIYIDNNSSSHFHKIKDSYKIYKEIIKFSLSSIISFIIDYILYLVFVLTIKNITISNVAARFLSGTFNYIINKNIVFKSKQKNTIGKYILLALTILILNTILLNSLVYLGINSLLAKLIVEAVLFILSWTIQKKNIF